MNEYIPNKSVIDITNEIELIRRMSPSRNLNRRRKHRSLDWVWILFLRVIMAVWIISLLCLVAYLFIG